MTGALRSEWLKLWKRPAVWILLAILITLLVLLLYVVGWLSTRSLSGSVNLGPGVTKSDLLRTYYPPNFHRQLLSLSSSLGEVMALLLGVLAVGSEYGWGTLKTMLTQGPGRFSALAGKLAVIAILLVVYVLVSTAAAAATSAALGAADGAALQWPHPIDIAKALLASWLMLAWGAAFGVLLSILFRQSALAIGLGLAYILVIEALIFSLLRQTHSSLLDNLQKVFPGPNATALTRSFGEPLHFANQPQPLVSGEQAALVLGAFVAGAILLSALLLRRQDVA
ncbi:MAG: ABC transporter permease subunit [Candidatus Dormibacteraeota bacterium]|nr:ABC transporter permease subunit [Candidatus Dormibacteraeota bacterium]